MHLAAEAIQPIRGLLLADIFRVFQVGIKRPAVPDTVDECGFTSHHYSRRRVQKVQRGVGPVG